MAGIRGILSALQNKVLFLWVMEEERKPAKLNQLNEKHQYEDSQAMYCNCYNRNFERGVFGQ